MSHGPILRGSHVVACLLLLCCVIVGCGDSFSEPTLIRLVDLCDEAAIQSSVDLAGDDQDLLGRYLPYEQGRFGEFARRMRVVHRGAWVQSLFTSGDVAGGDSNPLELRLLTGSIDIPSVTHAMRVSLPRPLRDNESLFLLVVSNQTVIRRLREPQDASDYLAEHLEEMVALRPALGKPSDPAMYWASFVPNTPNRRPMLCAVTYPETMKDASIHFAQIGAEGELVLERRDHGGSPWVAPITAARTTLDSLLIGAPGEARFRVAIPERSPRFECNVTVMNRKLKLRHDFEVEVTSATGTVRAEGSARGVGWSWTPLHLDLADLAGTEAEIVLRVSASQDEATSHMVAFGAPIVTGQREALPHDVIVVSLDTVRFDRLKTYGWKRSTSPSLDRVAADSVVFDTAVATSSWTLPSHVSIFSGQYPDRHGVVDKTSRIAAETPLLARAFRDTGYRTAAITGSGYLHPVFGFADGFDSYASCDPVGAPRGWIEAGGKLPQRKQKDLDSGATARSRERVLDLIRGPRFNPLFLFVHTYAAHEYRADPEVLREFGATDDELPSLLAGVYPVDKTAENRFFARDRSSEETERLKRRADLVYDGSVRAADELVGDVVRALEESGRLDRTILVITSDHGEELFEHGTFGHGENLYEEHLRVPLLIRVPGIVPGRRSALVSLVDLAPTLSELCRLDGGAFETDGQSLVPLLNGEEGDPRLVLAHLGNSDGRAYRAIRGTRKKFVKGVLEQGESIRSLFLLDLDPGENDDRADADPTQAARMDALLESWVRRLEERGARRTGMDLDAEVEEGLKELGYLGNE